jgi:cysteine desulfurase
MKNIYLDYAATTPVDQEVLKAMTPYFCEVFGNPSSVHSYGRQTRAAVDHSRETVSKFLNCSTTEIIFTSGGSESDNLAIRGVVDSAVKSQKSKVQNKLPIPHIITSQFEHHAVLNTVKELEREGTIEASYIKPGVDGLINPADIQSAIKANTLLVSIIYVNNEIGTVQPVREIGQLIERENARRIKNIEYGIENKSRNSKFQIPNSKENSGRIFFHTDAVQAAEYFKMDVDYLHVDLLTMTAHKIYGPKGVGLLYIRKGTPVSRLITGGEQEYRKRAGTENIAGIVGFAAAVRLVQSPKSKVQSENIQKLRDKLINGILTSIPDSFLNGSRELRSPANVNISFINAEGESILLNLDMEGIAASTGSACTSGALEPSHVLLSLGLKPEQCHGSIRFTLGRQTTEADINKVLEVLPQIIEKLRKMSPFK